MTSPLLDNADSSLPKLSYAVELQKLAATVGFDWTELHGVIDKVQEELNEVIAEVDTPNNEQRLLDEIGDLLFVCSSLARKLNVDPQQAIEHANHKFYRRFCHVEQLAIEKHGSLKQCPRSDLDPLWNQVKQIEKAKQKSD
jgi:ATP diphosphatase